MLRASSELGGAEYCCLVLLPGEGFQLEPPDLDVEVELDGLLQRLLQFSERIAGCEAARQLNNLSPVRTTLHVNSHGEFARHFVHSWFLGMFSWVT